jgi:hypothetical protein|tara:strand:- start:1721 stop:3148 length:1428 start_codon:yes stop_codon:yes gene_type:complete
MSISDFNKNKKVKIQIMKTNKILAFFAIVTMVIFSSCVQDDDFSIPNSLGEEENAGLQEILLGISDGSLTEISVSSLLSLYTGQATLIESDIVVKGYVSSTDETGNFYKEFYMQDAPENPTAAIGVSLNQVDSYNQFNKGREVYIRLNGLYLGENSSDVLTIGGQLDGNNLEEMTPNQIPDHVFRSSSTMDIVPLVLVPSEVNDSHLGMFVTFENMQFPLSLEGKTYVNPSDTFDTRHVMVSCVNGSEFQLETSSFANFKQVPLPTEGRGVISGVMTQGFGGSPRVMVLNSTDDVFFNDSRCDPVFEESFNSAVDGSNLNLDGWLNYAEDGSEFWTEQVYSGNGYAEFSAYNTGDSSNIGWLITPGIDMDAQEGEMLSFQTAYAYPDNGHYPLEVFVSTDFNGTETGVSDATWETLDAVIAHPDVNNSWFQFVDSGSIDLSSYSGTLYVAFKYTGSDTSNQNTTMHVENVAVFVQ